MPHKAGGHRQLLDIQLQCDKHLDLNCDQTRPLVGVLELTQQNHVSVKIKNKHAISGLTSEMTSHTSLLLKGIGHSRKHFFVNANIKNPALSLPVTKVSAFKVQLFLLKIVSKEGQYLTLLPPF